MIPVYLSHPTPHQSRQMVFLDKVKSVLESIGLKVIFLKSNSISAGETLNEIKNTITMAYGLIAVAYGRKRIESATVKYDTNLPGTVSDSLRNVKDTTVYIHIETAMAAAYGLPILIVREKGLLAEGVLEPCCFGSNGPEFDLDDCEYFSSDAWKKAIDQFSESVKKYYQDNSKNVI